MAKFIVTAQYRVDDIGDVIESAKEMEIVEAGRWQMFQKRFDIEILDLKVEKVKHKS